MRKGVAARRHHPGDVRVYRLEVVQPAPAPEPLEEQVGRDILAPLVAVLLEEIAPALHRAQAAHNTHLQVVEVGQSGAIVAAGGPGIGGEKRREELGEDG